MKLTFRRREVKDLSQLRTLVADHAEAVEPGFRVLATTVNFGRSTVELVGLDRHGTPALVALGFTADDAMLFRMVEAYAWSLEYPESVRRLMPAGGDANAWPPRVVFIAERLPESFLRKIRLLTFPAVNCFEYRCVDVNDAIGFYLDAVDWTRSAPAPAASPVIPAAEPARIEDAEREVQPAPQYAAAERTAPEATVQAQPSEPLGLLPPPSETPAAERSPERAESPAPVPASSAPVAATPEVVKPPRKAASQPPSTTEIVDLMQQLAANPEWQKFLEKLAVDDDLTAAATEKAVRPAPAPEKKPAAPHAVPSRNGGAARRADPKQRALLDVVKLPATGDLVPQWKKFLEKPSHYDAKVTIVREYLHREFPTCTLYDFYELRRNAQVIQLQDNHGKVVHLVTIMFEFFDAHSDSELRAVLDTMRLTQAMRQTGQAGVVVTGSGVEL